MTIRSLINQSKRKAAIATYTSFPIFIIGTLLSFSYHAFVPIAIIGFLGFMTGTAYMILGIRCPACRGGLGLVTASTSSAFSISRKIRFCPFCGVSLDSDPQKSP